MSKRFRIVSAVIALPVVLFLGIQIIPMWLMQSNPLVVAEPKWDSPQTRELAQRACFDCHSNETVWPWYSRVAPVSWLATFDVVNGRRHLNFSEWGVSTRGQGGEGGESGEGGEGREGSGQLSETILNGQMPPASYAALHPQATLTDAEKQQLITGLDASLK